IRSLCLPLPLVLFLFLILLPRPPRSTLFPYTTLFRSNGHRFPPAEVVQAYERELKLLPGSLIDLWEQSRLELLGEMRTRQRRWRSEEHTSELQSPYDLVCRLLLEKKKKNQNPQIRDPR